MTGPGLWYAGRVSPACRGIFTLLAVALVAPAAHAQTEEELTRARAQFREGVELVEAEQWEEALARFRAVAEVRDTPQVRYNLALALSHTEGGAPEASRILAGVVRDPETDGATDERARALLTQLRRDVATLVIRIRGDEAGTHVTVDGEEISLAQVGRPYEVSPGTHVIELRWGRHVRDHQDIDLGAGAREEIELDANGTYEETQLNASLQDAADGGAGGGDVTDEWWFWTAIGVGGAIVLGLIIGFAASAAQSDPQPITGNLDPGVLMVMP